MRVTAIVTFVVTAALAVLIQPFTAFAQAVTGLDAVSSKAAQVGKIRVIARLSPAAAPEGLALVGSTLATAQTNLRSRMLDVGVAYARPIAELPLVVLELDQSQLDSLIASGQIAAVQEDRIERAYLADSAPLIGAPDVWAKDVRGAGQAVAILDTGVDRKHPFLVKRVVAEACFSSNSPQFGATTVCPNGQTSETGPNAGRPCAVPGCEHGTHVAGIAAGNGSPAKVDFSGVAPEASIVAIQVFSRFDDRPGGPNTCASLGTSSPCVLTFISDQIEALQHVRNIADKIDIAAVNMSLGGGHFTAACDGDFRKPIVDELLKLGIATVVASGNDFFEDGVGAPACISTVVTVGATSKSDKIAPFSNSSEQLDLLAPGADINSSVPGGGYDVFDGTSMATPHVAGAFALLASGVPGAGAMEIEKALKDTGVPILDPRNNLKRPRIDVWKALAAL